MIVVGRVGEGVGVYETMERGEKTCKRRAQIQMFLPVWNRNKNKKNKKKRNEMKDEKAMKTSPCPVSLGWPVGWGKRPEGGKVPKRQCKSI